MESRRAARMAAPGPRIVVVDDDPDARLFLGAMLESCLDSNVVLAACVDEAIASISRVLPDVVVTDAMMPGEDGLALLRRLRAVPRAGKVPVVVATSSGDSELVREMRAAGVVAVLRKPASPEDLNAAIATALASGGP